MYPLLPFFLPHFINKFPGQEEMKNRQIKQIYSWENHKNTFFLRFFHHESISKCGFRIAPPFFFSLVNTETPFAFPFLQLLSPLPTTILSLFFIPLFLSLSLPLSLFSRFLAIFYTCGCQGGIYFRYLNNCPNQFPEIPLVSIPNFLQYGHYWTPLDTNGWERSTGGLWDWKYARDKFGCSEIGSTRWTVDPFTWSLWWERQQFWMEFGFCTL